MLLPQCVPGKIRRERTRTNANDGVRRNTTTNTTTTNNKERATATTSKPPQRQPQKHHHHHCCCCLRLINLDIYNCKCHPRSRPKYQQRVQRFVHVNSCRNSARPRPPLCSSVSFPFDKLLHVVCQISIENIVAKNLKNEQQLISGQLATNHHWTRVRHWWYQQKLTRKGLWFLFRREE